MITTTITIITTTIMIICTNSNSAARETDRQTLSHQEEQQVTEHKNNTAAETPLTTPHPFHYSSHTWALSALSPQKPHSFTFSVSQKSLQEGSLKRQSILHSVSRLQHRLNFPKPSSVLGTKPGASQCLTCLSQSCGATNQHETS